MSDDSSSEGKRRANWAVKIVAISISAGIIMSFLIGYFINEIWK